MPTPKEAYDARQKLKRISRHEELDHLSDEDVTIDLIFSLAERFVSAVESIAVSMKEPH